MTQASKPKPAILPEADWHKLVEDNMLLVYKEAHRAKSRFMYESDSEVQAEGLLALVKAARAYDPSYISPKTGKSIKFSTYAVRVLRNHYSSLYSKSRQAKRDCHPKSLSQQDMSELVDHRAESLSPDDRDELEVLRATIHSDVLDPTERAIIKGISQGRTVKQIAKKLRMNPLTIAELRDQAIIKLRDKMGVELGQDADAESRE